MFGFLRIAGLSGLQGAGIKAGRIEHPEHLRGDPREPYSMAERKRNARRPPSFTDQLPWMGFEAEHGTFVLEDGVSRALLFELDPLPSEARPEAYLAARAREIQSALSALPEFDDAPWVVQFFCNDDTELSGAIEAMRGYILECNANTPARAREILESAYTQSFLADLAEHVRVASRAEGLFHDEGVSGNRWRAQKRRVRCALYRKFPPDYDFARDPMDPIEALHQAADGLMAGLGEAGVGARPMSAIDFYAWLLPVFNPAPDFAQSIAKMLALCPYPAEDEAAGPVDLGEILLLNSPRSDADTGLWFFDARPHRALALQSLRDSPQIGHFSAEREQAGKQFARLDRFPAGSMLSATLVVSPQDSMTGRIQGIQGASRATTLDAEKTHEEATRVLDRMGKSDKLFPFYLTLIVSADDTVALRKTVAQLSAVMHSSGLKFIEPRHELMGCDVFMRALPMGFDPSFDARVLRRSRLMFTSQIAALLPLYGRSRGTGHPGFWLWNRGGEPFVFDPLNRQDRKKNAHLLMLGQTGAGKSATLNYLCMQVMAIHRCRLVIVDAGRSFGLLGQHFKAHGLSLHQVDLTPDADVSLPPFAMAGALLDQEARTATELEASLSRDDDLVDDADEEDDERRDLLGEMVIQARLMITGGEASEIDKMSRADRYLIARAVLDAARAARAGGKPHPRSEDVANALIAMRSDDELGAARQARGEEMGQAMMVFCDGLRGRLFNRYGSQWPDADVTIVEMGTLAQEGYEDALAVAYTSLVNHVQAVAEATQNDDRPIIFLTDEGHIITTNALLAAYVVKITKMWRKLGTWFWLATQNMQDFPDATSRMLNMCEWWVLLTMEREEIDQVARFRTLTDEQRSLMESASKEPPKYTEGVVLSASMQALFRNIPPPLPIALAMTEKHEKAERRAIMERDNCSELEAAYRVAEQLARRRG
ncbi:MAG: conjugative transfer ATPase [Rhodocyclaceae bacterium]|nr:conjugative transfer ATPase [Rhodocyclaceae bacterium]